MRLVDDLLDVGRLTTGKIALARAPVDLAAVVRRGVTAVASEDSPSRIECRAAEPVWMEADETRLEQIVSNLLGNALKFTPPDGRIVVEVSAAAGEADPARGGYGDGHRRPTSCRGSSICSCRGRRSCTALGPGWASG